MKAHKFLIDQLSKTAPNPVLRAVLVYNERMQMQNGSYAIDSPTHLPPMLVDGTRLWTAANACKDTPVYSIGDRFLTVTAGRMRARIALLDPNDYPTAVPDPVIHFVPDELTSSLRQLLPFIGTDSSRPWCTAVCLAPSGHAYTTNNSVIARIPIDTRLKQPVMIPSATVAALVAGSLLWKTEIISIGISTGSITFYFDDSTWIKSHLVEGSWPIETAGKLIGSIGDGWLAVNPELEPMLATAVKLIDEKHPAIVEFKDSGFALDGDAFTATGLDPVPAAGRINARIAATVFEKATEVQWHTPQQDRHAFRSGDLVGVFVGSR